MILGTDATVVAYLALVLAELVLLNLAVLLAQRGRRVRRRPLSLYRR